ncbi:TetR/AcrR family transcriptional regulator [Demequina sp. NBRC 110054]|uniref:TetR/AcrR family transcriptional regulator n=1 Tax=Demequina sp. NBRC 110054 TaxID=1570343 RepID=UPI000A04A2BD|nr:TetR/AcrR family transcriptional regulator [Demequina sp. NBRC 110054]
MSHTSRPATPSRARTRGRDAQRLSGADRKAQIVDAATALIAERGFWGTSIQDVAAACGVTVAGVLYHVGSKDGLLIEVLEHRDRLDAEAIAAELDRPVLVEPASGDVSVIADVSLAQFCDALVRRNARQPEIVRLYSVLEAESLEPSHPAHGYFLARQREGLGNFAALAADAPDPDRLARQVLALMDGLQVQWLRDVEHFDLVAEWIAASAGLDGFAR